MIAASLLAGTFLLFSTIFAAALRGTADAGDMATAVAEANTQLARLEALADQDSWTELLSADGRATESQGFEVEISVREVPLFSTSTSTEAAFAPTLDRRLDSVLAQVEVQVSRDGVSTRQVKLLSRPRKRLGDPPIEFRGLSGSPLGRDDSVILTAHLIGADGAEIPAFFHFYVLPQSGNGSLAVPRNGREATFKNVVSGRLGTFLYTGGNCRLRARANYFGSEVSNDSIDLELEP